MLMLSRLPQTPSFACRRGLFARQRRASGCLLLGSSPPPQLDLQFVTLHVSTSVRACHRRVLALVSLQTPCRWYALEHAEVVESMVCDNKWITAKARTPHLP